MTDAWRNPRRTGSPPTGRMEAEDRRLLLVQAGLPLAEIHGFDKVTREMVALATNTSPGLLSHYWTAPDYQTALMAHAVETEALPVIAQGLALGHPLALAAPEALRRAAAMFLAERS